MAKRKIVTRYKVKTPYHINSEIMIAPPKTGVELIVLSLLALGIVGSFIWVVINKVAQEGETPEISNELVFKSLVNPDVFTEAANDLFSFYNKKSIVQTTDPIKGSQGVKVTIIEFANFESPNCARVREKLDKIYELYKDHVRIVWKDFPLEEVYPNAKEAAIAARCAQRQNKFWEMHAVLFDHYLELSEEKYQELAAEIDLNLDQFNECRQSGVVNGYINANKSEGESLNITNIPYIYINNQSFNGNVEFNDLKTAIDQELLP